MDVLMQANDWLVATFGEMGPLYAVGVLGVLLIGLTLPFLLKGRKDPLDKLREANAPRRTSQAGDKRKALRHDPGHGEKLDKFATFLEPQNEEEMSSARLKMLQAGYRSRNAVRTFHFLQMVLAITAMLGGLIYVVVSSAGDTSIEVHTLALAVILPGAVGYYLPKYWVQRRIQSRQEDIQNGFPDSLDMLLVCVEAGQSMEQAILRVAKEIRAGFPALSEEYETVASEMKAGKEKSQVLKDMAERAGVPDVASFVTVLIQSASFGTSIADALRVYASEMRDKRVMRAEEKANVLPTKLTLGTMMFCLPPLLMILLSPSLHDIYVNLIENGM